MSTLFAGLIPKPGAGYVRLQQALLRLAYEESCIVEGKLDLLQIVKHGTVTQNPFLVWLNQTRIQSTAFAFQWKRMGETFKQNRLTSFAKQYDDLYAYITDLDADLNIEALQERIECFITENAQNQRVQLYLNAFEPLFNDDATLLPMPLYTIFTQQVFKHQDSLGDLVNLAFALVLDIQLIAWMIKPIETITNNPLRFETMYQILAQHGPLLASGTNGSYFYRSNAIVPKQLNIDGKILDVLTLQASKRKSDTEINASLVLHVVIIIGAIKYQGITYVLFHDINHLAKPSERLPIFLSRADNFITRIKPMNAGNPYTKLPIVYLFKQCLHVC